MEVEWSLGTQKNDNNKKKIDSCQPARTAQADMGRHFLQTHQFLFSQKMANLYLGASVFGDFMKHNKNGKSFRVHLENRLWTGFKTPTIAYLFLSTVCFLFSKDW